MGSSSAAKKAWESRRWHGGGSKKAKSSAAHSVDRASRGKRHGRKLDAGRKKRFLAARQAVLDTGWKPFTKMSKSQKALWSKTFHGE